MFNISKPLVLPPELHWKYTNEPELLARAIRARNYNTFVANAMFWFCFITITNGSIFLYRSTEEDPVFNVISTLLFLITVTTALISITHQRMNFAYRFTRSGIECCEWKDFTQLAIATNREVVDLKFCHFDQRLGRIVKWNLNIFCKRKQKEAVANFIKPYLSPDVPFIKAKVNVPMSTD